MASVRVADALSAMHHNQGRCDRSSLLETLVTSGLSLNPVIPSEPFTGDRTSAARATVDLLAPAFLRGSAEETRSALNPTARP